MIKSEFVGYYEIKERVFDGRVDYILSNDEILYKSNRLRSTYIWDLNERDIIEYTPVFNQDFELIGFNGYKY